MKNKPKKIKLETWNRQDARCLTYEVEPWRLDGKDERQPIDGDIYRSYLNWDCDKRHAPNAIRSLRSCFFFNGLRYVYTGGCHSWVMDEADCYELVRVTPDLILPSRKQFDYSGELRKLEGVTYVLCRPIRLISRVPTLEEARWTLRTRFAHDGHYARQHDGKARAYHCCLREFVFDNEPPYNALHEPDHELNNQSQREDAERLKVYYKAAELEIADKSIPVTAEALRKLCLKDPIHTEQPWKQAPKPKPGKLALTLSADDFLAAMLK